MSNHHLYQHNLITQGLLPKIALLTSTTTDPNIKVYFCFHLSPICISMCITIISDVEEMCGYYYSCYELAETNARLSPSASRLSATATDDGCLAEIPQLTSRCLAGRPSPRALSSTHTASSASFSLSDVEQGHQPHWCLHTSALSLSPILFAFTHPSSLIIVLSPEANPVLFCYELSLLLLISIPFKSYHRIRLETRIPTNQTK